MRFDWWTLALQTVNFAVLVWLLHRFLYKPVLRMIDARKTEIQGQYAAANAAQATALAAHAAIELERSGIAAERESVLLLAAKQAQEAAQAYRIQSEREAQTALEAARKTIAAEREHALAQARELAWNLGTVIARRLLAEIPFKLRAEAWLERIEQQLRMLPASQLDALVQQLADGTALTIVTAAALSPVAIEAWSTRLRMLVGSDVALAFQVQSELVAGAELHFPTTVLRFSWASVLQSLRSERGSHADAG